MRMKKIKILLISMLIITAVYLGAVVYANSSSSSGGGGIDAAFLYHGVPEKWYTPEQLGIVDIGGYSENATWIQVVYGEQGPLVNPEVEEPPIFKYKGKFWQISTLHVTPGLPEEAKKWQVPIGGVIGAAWIFTGIVSLRVRGER